MAIRKISEIPETLPFARLYLDDIEEVSTILLDAYAPYFNARNDEAVIVYNVGDSQMDTLDDLRTLGGSSSNFEMRITGGKLGFGSGASLTFHTSSPTLRLYSLEDSERWSTYGRVKALFDRRSMRMRNAVWSLPAWVRWPPLLVFVFLPNIVLQPDFMPRKMQGDLMIGWIVVIGLIGLGMFRRSRVFFVRFHEKSKISREARKGYARDFIFLVLGALIGKVIDLVGHRLFQK
jgi:hypothetical protein